MRKPFAIAFACLCLTSVAQFTGGMGGGGGVNCMPAINWLPVELIHFSAAAEGMQVLVEWTTASELNNGGFHVERSIDGVRFDAIAEVEGAGTAHTVTDYQTIDKAPLPGLSYYRLRQTDLDGTTTWSEAVAVEMKALRIAAYPNPVRSMLTIQGVSTKDVAQVQVFDTWGRSVMQAALPEGAIEIDMGGLPAGLYRVRIAGEQGPETLSVVKE